MATLPAEVSANARSNWPDLRKPQSVRAALADRLNLSEAIDIVGQMLRGYPNGQQVPDSYIGALAEVVAQYPRCIALRAGDLKMGVQRETKFLPTVADIVAWAERETNALRGIVDKDDHYAALEQAVADRAREAERIVEARKTRPTYNDLKSKYGENWGLSVMEQQDAMVSAARTALTERANRAAFVRECEAAGVDPNEGVSPTLRELLHPKQSEQAA